MYRKHFSIIVIAQFDFSDLDGKGRDAYLHVLIHRHVEKETATELSRMANLLYLKIFVLEPGVDVLEGGEVLDRVITKQQFR